jgi:hypothetical protein
MSQENDEIIYNASAEIFKRTTPSTHIVSIIDYYANKYSGNKEMYYVALLGSFLNRKKNINALVYHPDKKIIRAEITGTILYINEDAIEWEPLYIIGKTTVDVDTILTNISNQLEGKSEDRRALIFENFNGDLFKSHRTKIVLRNRYKNPTLLPKVKIDFAIGEEVSKNTIIGVIDCYDYSKFALTAIAKREILETYIDEKIKELNPKSIRRAQRHAFDKKKITDKNKKELNLYDIWKGNDIQYNQLFNELIMPYNELNSSGFIRIEGVKAEGFFSAIHSVGFELESPNTAQGGHRIFWCEEPKKGWQRYLAGMLFALDLYEFIDKRDFSGYDFIQICKNTFNMTKLDNEPFNDLKNGVLDNKFIKEFERRFKRLF